MSVIRGANEQKKERPGLLLHPDDYLDARQHVWIDDEIGGRISYEQRYAFVYVSRSAKAFSYFESR